MKEKLEIAALLDTYGELLTGRQRQFIEDYYHHDLSLCEIAANHNVSRQAVFNSIKTTKNLLNNYEEKLSLKAIKDGLKQAISAEEDKRISILNQLVKF